MGAVLNISLANRTGEAVSSERMRRLLDGAGGVPGDAALRGVLGDAIHLAFWAVLIVAMMTLLAATFVPRIAMSTRGRTT